MLVIFAVVALATSACAMYDSSSAVVELTEANFKTRVINDDSIWVVEFYAPWCGHCKSLVPEYNKAAAALKGLVKVGAVDMTQHQSVGSPYNVQGFPTIKIFGGNKGAPTDFQGARTAQAIVDAAINELKKTASTRLSGKGGSSGGGSSSGGSGGSGGKKAPPPGSKDDVVELTDSNFEELVLKSDDMWLVEFYAPWCGHCKNLAPHWEAAATELKGKVKLGALDATVHQVMSNRFGVRGFPTIKYFPAGGGKSITDAVDYDGGRTGSDIVSWALGKAAENVPAPEIKEAISTDILKDACDEKQLCVIAVLPHILDCQSKCRNDYLRILKDLGEKFRKNMWGWVWAEAGQQPELEDAFGIGGFGYPAMAALNSRKMKFAILKGPFSYDGINEFLRDLSYGKGQTAPIKGAALPALSATQPWDGKDGQMPKDDDIDLSDVDLDDEDSKKTESKKEKKDKKDKKEL